MIYSRIRETVIKKPIDYEVIEKVKIVSKEKSYSNKVNREYGKIYVDDGTDKNKLLMVYQNTLLEQLDTLKENVWYNFFGEKKGIFFHVEGWELWNCPNCQKEKIKKLLVSANTRTFVIRSIFTSKLNLWKIQPPSTIPLKDVKDLFDDIVEELDKEFIEQKRTLESLKE